MNRFPLDPRVSLKEAILPFKVDCILCRGFLDPLQYFEPTQSAPFSCTLHYSIVTRFVSRSVSYIPIYQLLALFPSFLMHLLPVILAVSAAWPLVFGLPTLWGPLNSA